MRSENLDKLILQQITKVKRHKIEKIEEEDEANSSMQSDQSDAKKDNYNKDPNYESHNEHNENYGEGRHIKNLVRPIKLRTEDSIPNEEVQTHKKRSKSNTNLDLLLIDEYPSKNDFSNKNTERKELITSDKQLKSQSYQKISLSTRKVNPLNTYKVNSVSLLNMLQNKTHSLLKHVISIERISD